MDNHLKSLLTLLNDDNDDIARAAMLELIDKYRDELNVILSELQESNYPLLRKRCHQLQSFISLQQRRENLSNYIHSENSQMPLIDALIEFHLLWFDKDSFVDIKQDCADFIKTFKVNPSKLLQSIKQFMQECQFAVLDENSTDSELYMLGAVLDSKHGAEGFFATLIIALLELANINNVHVIKFENHLYIYDPYMHQRLSITHNWEILPFDIANQNIEIFSKNTLLKYLLAIAFANSINNDEFRYTQVLGEILTTNPTHSLSFLPYPYGKKKK